MNGEMHPKKTDLWQISSLSKRGTRAAQTPALCSVAPPQGASGALSRHDGLQTPGGSLTHPPGVEGPAKGDLATDTSKTNLSSPGMQRRKSQGGKMAHTASS